MTGILLRILSIILLLWLVRRIITAFQAPKSSNKKKPETAEDNVMVKDPVCGMYMDARLALRMENKGKSIYFCSEECKTRYLQNPPHEGS